MALALSFPGVTHAISISPPERRTLCMGLNETSALARNVECLNVHGANFTHIPHISDSSGPSLRRALGGRRVDVFVIDGCHALRCVFRDFTHFAPFVRPGGVLLMDDYGDPSSSGVRVGVHKIKRRFCAEADPANATLARLAEFSCIGALPNVAGAGKTCGYDAGGLWKGCTGADMVSPEFSNEYLIVKRSHRHISHAHSR